MMIMAINAQTQATREHNELIARSMSRGGTHGHGGLEDDKTLGSLRSVREREAYQVELDERPLEVHDRWFGNLRNEYGAVDGEPMSMLAYGEKMFGDLLKGHSTLHRFWKILSFLHVALTQKGRNAGLGMLATCSKAVARAIRQKGQWAGAWEFTLQPDIGETLGGCSMDEEAAVGRFMRERAVTAKAMSEAPAKT